MQSGEESYIIDTDPVLLFPPRIFRRQFGVIPIKKYVGTRVAKPAKKKKQKKSSGAGHAFLNGLTAFFVTILVLAAAVLTFGFTLKYGTTVYPNVTAFGVNVGGLTLEEATKKVQAETSSAYAQPLRLLLPDQTVTLEPAQTAVKLDVGDAVEQALSYGRDGGPLSALFTWLDCRNTAHHVGTERSLTFNENYVSQVLRDAASAAELPLVESTAVYDADEEQIHITIGSQSQWMDYAQARETVVDALHRGDFSDIRLDYEHGLYQPLDLTAIYKAYCTPKKDAYYDTETRSLARESIGYGFDLEAAQQRVNQATDGDEITIQFEYYEPDVYLEDLESRYFQDVLAEYSSPHSTYNPGRTVNLELACKEINKTILNPGEEFSFNKVVGERTTAKGYQAASVYVEGGGSEDQTGGGVCQVASTMYMAVLLSDLKVTERYPHMYAVEYVPMGMDATVYWGSLDFRFVNSTDYPIIIYAEVANGYVHVKFVGTKTSPLHVEMSYEILSTDPWTQTTYEDPSLAPGVTYVAQTAYTGYKVQTWKHYYDDAGTLLDTKQCAFSQYTRRDRIVYVGPTIDPPAPAQP